MTSFIRGFKQGYISLAFYFMQHRYLGAAFTIIQHGVGFYFLGWYWLALIVASTALSTTILYWSYK